jgi:cation:H+ antiporter
MDLLFLLLGLGLLAFGGDILIRGAVGLSERLRVPPLVIGMTVVAFGTSLPELLVSVAAGYEGNGGIAVGNVVGSNIANILLILAVPALFGVTKLDDEGIGRNLVILLAVTAIFMSMLWTGSVGRLSGLLLLGMFALFVRDQIVLARSHRDMMAAHEYHDEIGPAPQGGWAIAALILTGLALLPVGADLTVNGASGIARSLGVSDELIGLTVVAVGTSLPELAASLLAVMRNNGGVAVGNVIGSNIFNILAIMGVTATAFPLEIAPRVWGFDMWVMGTTALLLAWMAARRMQIDIRASGLMAGAYASYVGVSLFQ